MALSGLLLSSSVAVEHFAIQSLLTLRSRQTRLNQTQVHVRPTAINSSNDDPERVKRSIFDSDDLARKQGVQLPFGVSACAGTSARHSDTHENDIPEFTVVGGDGDLAAALHGKDPPNKRG